MTSSQIEAAFRVPESSLAMFYCYEQFRPTPSRCRRRSARSMTFFWIISFSFASPKTNASIRKLNSKARLIGKQDIVPLVLSPTPMSLRPIQSLTSVTAPRRLTASQWMVVDPLAGPNEDGYVQTEHRYEFLWSYEDDSPVSAPNRTAFFATLTLGTYPRCQWFSCVCQCGVDPLMTRLSRTDTGGAIWFSETPMVRATAEILVRASSYPTPDDVALTWCWHYSTLRIFMRFSEFRFPEQYEHDSIESFHRLCVHVCKPVACEQTVTSHGNSVTLLGLHK